MSNRIADRFIVGGLVFSFLVDVWAWAVTPSVFGRTVFGFLTGMTVALAIVSLALFKT